MKWFLGQKWNEVHLRQLLSPCRFSIYSTVSDGTVLAPYGTACGRGIPRDLLGAKQNDTVVNEVGFRGRIACCDDISAPFDVS